MNTACDAIHQVAFGVARLARNHEHTRFGVVEITDAFEDRLDGPIDAEARIREDSNFLEQFETVLQLSVIATPARDDVAEDENADWRQQEIDRGLAGGQQSDDCKDAGGSKCQFQPVAESPAK